MLRSSPPPVSAASLIPPIACLAEEGTNLSSYIKPSTDIRRVRAPEEDEDVSIPSLEENASAQFESGPSSNRLHMDRNTPNAPTTIATTKTLTSKRIRVRKCSHTRRTMSDSFLLGFGSRRSTLSSRSTASIPISQVLPIAFNMNTTTAPNPMNLASRHHPRMEVDRPNGLIESQNHAMQESLLPNPPALRRRRPLKFVSWEEAEASYERHSNRHRKPKPNKTSMFKWNPASTSSPRLIDKRQLNDARHPETIRKAPPTSLFEPHVATQRSQSSEITSFSSGFESDTGFRSSQSTPRTCAETRHYSPASNSKPRRDFSVTSPSPEFSGEVLVPNSASPIGSQEREDDTWKGEVYEDF